ncbi:predicted protein [Naegleria gruberi]|uniref:Predicted protein n=1 Tax=Naegleria gruberi TaxID=5762 RepID=D2VK54_NAEGR|nr:uncharacterized protein NAEGRDRAFT_69274 [Naegleria gruberi]EFC42888.1 predicted protein [Naegleria gruberi]|eukprot:XP_002675632.1 predicted protein [Naegleria gruberi strain NEG-M]
MQQHQTTSPAADNDFVISPCLSSQGEETTPILHNIDPASVFDSPPSAASTIEAQHQQYVMMMQQQMMMNNNNNEQQQQQQVAREEVDHQQEYQEYVSTPMPSSLHHPLSDNIFDAVSDSSNYHHQQPQQPQQQQQLSNDDATTTTCLSTQFGGRWV